MKKLIPIPKKKTESDLDDVAVFKNGRTIYFFDEVTNQSVCKAIIFLDELEKEKSKQPIEFVLNSVGGDIYSGLALYDRIRRSSCDVHTIGTGFVASMAVIIYLAGDYRYITETCTFLNHQGSTELYGKVTDLKIEFDETNRIEEICTEIIASHTGLPAKKIKADIKLGDDYINPERAVNDGFSHEIIKNQRIVRKRRRRTTK